MDLKLDNSHDVVWENGPLTKAGVTSPFAETVGQRLKIRLLTFQNEWFFNTTYGVPFWQRLLGIKQTSKASIDLIFNQKILEEPGVKEITYFSSTFEQRIYSLTFKVKVVDGTVTQPITINPTN